MKIYPKILFIVLLFCSIVAKSQDTVYMPYFQLENIYWEHQLSAAKSFNTYINNAKRYSLILPKLKGTSYPNETFTQTISNAKTIGAKYFIIGKLKGVTDVMEISMSLYNTSDSSLIWNDTLIARTTNDLDTVLKLFANNIGTEKKASSINKNYTKEHYYPKELIKPYASFNFGVTISEVYTMVNEVKNKTSTGFGFLLSYDSRRFIFDLQGDYLNGDVRINDIKLSGLIPLMNTKTTPFIGGSIALSEVSLFYPSPSVWTFFNNSNADGYGMTLFLNAGYLMKRNWKLKFRLNGSYYYSFFHPETAANYSKTKRPTGFIINAIVLI